MAIYASPVDEATIEQVIQNAHIQGYSFSRQYEVKEVRYTGNKDASYASTLMARTDPGSYKVTGAEWGTRPNGVYVRQFINIPVGSDLIVTDLEGTKHKLKIVGTFEYVDQAAWPGLSNYFLVSDTLASRIGKMESSQYFLELDPNLVTEHRCQPGKGFATGNHHLHARLSGSLHRHV